jgi:hypothetical protein
VSKKYYKVVSKTLKSVVIEKEKVKLDGKDYRLRVQYKIGEFVSANVSGTKLMVFDTLENAVKFNRNNRIFLVEVEGIASKGICLCYITCFLPEILKIKNRKKGYLNHWTNALPPEGTLFAEKVKLIEEIKFPT